jgi:hypothetical protein
MAWALWQLATQDPLIPPLAAGLLLVILGSLAGLRIGTDSVGRFLKELTALNKYLGERNRDLAEMNHTLLKQLSLKQAEPQDSTMCEPVDERK